jgi:hypothetical protein
LLGRREREGEGEGDEDEGGKEVSAGGTKLYLLAVPDCLRCAQYSLDDSVMAHTNRKCPRLQGERETWLCTMIQTTD